MSLIRNVLASLIGTVIEILWERIANLISVLMILATIAYIVIVGMLTLNYLTAPWLLLTVPGAIVLGFPVMKRMADFSQQITESNIEGIEAVTIDQSEASDMELLQRITIEPGKCGGKPCIRGIRIRVSDVLGLLAAGLTREQVLEQFPYLELDDILACLQYAAREVDTPHAVAK